ncbi:hypothetical protein B0T24DRAFT_255401 [Lasiosphaeria ovina]|uniref:Uncharacterized protein n=1 Tax=Lasiosphaeria ovina TaxID=92902 RepID=A0AAE0N8F3_9PEZI|nr:hypothetical protein B0T24DRAFT_255401 [Lasiosphaeria ovina]
MKHLTAPASLAVSAHTRCFPPNGTGRWTGPPFPEALYAPDTSSTYGFPESTRHEIILLVRWTANHQVVQQERDRYHFLIVLIESYKSASQTPTSSARNHVLCHVPKPLAQVSAVRLMLRSIMRKKPHVRDEIVLDQATFRPFLRLAHVVAGMVFAITALCCHVLPSRMHRPPLVCFRAKLPFLNPSTRSAILPTKSATKSGHRSWKDTRLFRTASPQGPDR